MTSPTASSVMPSCRALNQIERLPFRRRPVGAGMDVDGLVDRIAAAASSASWIWPLG